MERGVLVERAMGPQRIVVGSILRQHTGFGVAGRCGLQLRRPNTLAPTIHACCPTQLWPIISRDLYLPTDSETKRIFEQRQLNCSFLLAVRSELLEEAPQILGVLLVLNPRKHHFGARNLRLGIFDVFLEGSLVPDDPGIFVRIRVTVAWHRA